MEGKKSRLFDHCRICRSGFDLCRHPYQKSATLVTVMNIIVLGLNHRTAPVELRELLAIQDSRMGEALGRLMAYPGIKEAMYLGTCNRVEVYAVVEKAEWGFRQLEDFLVSTHFSLSSEDLLPHLYRCLLYTSDAADD